MVFRMKLGFMIASSVVAVVLAGCNSDSLPENTQEGSKKTVQVPKDITLPDIVVLESSVEHPSIGFTDSSGELLDPSGLLNLFFSHCQNQPDAEELQGSTAEGREMYINCAALRELAEESQ